MKSSATRPSQARRLLRQSQDASGRGSAVDPIAPPRPIQVASGFGMGVMEGNRALGWVEQGLVPDRVARLGIRRLLKERLAEIGDGDAEAAARISQAFAASLAASPVALLTEKANEQHYEVPAAF